MGLVNPEKKYYTYEQYLLLEQETGVRHEYYKGEVFAMAGGTKRHNRLTTKIFRLFDDIFSNKGCETYVSDVKLELAHLDHYVYPDVIVTCHPEDLANDEMVYVNHPNILVEILSKSTQNLGLRKVNVIKNKKQTYF
jgi:Uma2 family endonuclease